MPTKAELYAQMADKVATQLTGSWQEWAGCSVLLSVLGKRKAGNLKDFPLGKTVNIKF